MQQGGASFQLAIPFDGKLEACSTSEGGVQAACPSLSVAAMRSAIEKKILAGFLFALVAFVTMGYLTYRNAEHLLEARDLVPHTEQAWRLLKQIRAMVAQTETSAHGYVITGEVGFLESFEQARSEVGSRLDTLEQLTRKDRAEREHAGNLKLAVASELALLQRIIAARQSGGLEAARELITASESKQLMGQIRRVIAEMETHQERLLLEQTEEADQSSRMMLATVLLAGGVSLSVLSLIYGLTALDIRARRKAEASLLAAEEFKSRILESSGDSIAVLDLEGRILSLNREELRRFPMPELKSVLHTSWTESWSELSREAARHALAQALGGAPGRFRGLRATFSAAPKWWDVLVTPIMGESGRPERILSVARDMTEIGAAEEKFRALFEHSADALLLLENGAFVDCNEAAVQLLAYPNKEALLGLRPAEVSPPRQPDGRPSGEKTAEILEQVGGAGSIRYEWQYQRTDGELVLVEANLARLDLSGRPMLLAVLRDLTERQRASAALHESEERFTAFMQHSPMVAFIKEEDGRYIYVNRAFEEQFDVKFAPQLQAKTDADWLPAETAAALAQTEQTVLTSNKMLRLTQVVPTGNGEQREWMVLKFPMGTLDGRRLIGGVGLEMTKQKRAEKALRASEARFRDLFYDAPVAYHELDTENRITRVNGTELAMLGYSGEEMVGQPVWHFMVDEVGERLVAAQQAPEIRTEATQCIFRRKDGSTVPVLMRHKLIWDDAAMVCGMRSTLQDISALKRIEADLRAAEEKYRSIYENAIEGIFRSTPEGVFLEVNPAFARIYGYDSPEEVKGCINDIAHQIYVDPHRRVDFLQLIEQKGEVSDFESEIHQKGARPCGFPRGRAWFAMQRGASSSSRGPSRTSPPGGKRRRPLLARAMRPWRACG